MKRLMILCSACVLCFPLIAHAGAEAKTTTTKKSTVTYSSGPMVDVFNDLEVCQGAYEDCNENLEACKFDCSGGTDKPPPPPKEKACKNKYDDDGDGLMDCEDPDCMHRKMCKEGFEPKKKKTCHGDPALNGIIGYWQGLYKLCGIEAEMDGTCMTMKQSYGALMCLHDQMNDLRKAIEHMDMVEIHESDPVDTSKFATKKELQAQVENLMAWINSIIEANKERDKKLEGLADELEKLKAELEKLRELVLQHEACLKPWDHPDMFETDVYGKILSESYREKCGILADIPEVKDRLDAIEECLSFSDAFKRPEEFKKACEPFNWVLEVQSALDGIYLCMDPLHPYWNGNMEEYALACPFYTDQLCHKTEHDEALKRVDGDEDKLKEICKNGKKIKAILGEEVALAGMCFGTFRGDVFCGGVLSWTALLIKKDDHKIVEFSVFAGALAGVTPDADGGITYGGKVTFYPGKQEIFGIYIGYQGLSSGVFEAEYPGEPDPDTQHHAAMAGIVLEKGWVIKEVDGKIFKIGIYGSGGLGVAYEDNNAGSGAVGAWEAEGGLFFTAEF